MRYRALATDYDGTVAHHGTVTAETAASLEALKHSGRTLLLVTGRELPDLQRVCPMLDLFDRCVVENGAVIYTPATDQRARVVRAAATDPGRHPASARRDADLRRPRHRGDVGAAREDRARGDPRPRARAAGDLQQGRRDDPAVRRQQGQRPAGGALQHVPLAPQRRRRRRRGKRSRAAVDERVRRGGGERRAAAERARGFHDGRKGGRWRQRADRRR